MSTLTNIENAHSTNVRIGRDMFHVILNDGREIGVPYSWYPRLTEASPKHSLIKNRNAYNRYLAVTFLPTQIRQGILHDIADSQIKHLSR